VRTQADRNLIIRAGVSNEKRTASYAHTPWSSSSSSLTTPAQPTVPSDPSTCIASALALLPHLRLHPKPLLPLTTPHSPTPVTHAPSAPSTPSSPDAHPTPLHQDSPPPTLLAPPMRSPRPIHPPSAPSTYQRNSYLQQHNTRLSSQKKAFPPADINQLDPFR